MLPITDPQRREREVAVLHSEQLIGHSLSPSAGDKEETPSVI